MEEVLTGGGVSGRGTTAKTTGYRFQSSRNWHVYLCDLVPVLIRNLKKKNFLYLSWTLQDTVKLVCNPNTTSSAKVTHAPIKCLKHQMITYYM